MLAPSAFVTLKDYSSRACAISALGNDFFVHRISNTFCAPLDGQTFRSATPAGQARGDDRCDGGSTSVWPEVPCVRSRRGAARGLRTAPRRGP